MLLLAQRSHVTQDWARAPPNPTTNPKLACCWRLSRPLRGCDLSQRHFDLVETHFPVKPGVAECAARLFPVGERPVASFLRFLRPNFLLYLSGNWNAAGPYHLAERSWTCAWRCGIRLASTDHIPLREIFGWMHSDPNGTERMGRKSTLAGVVGEVFLRDARWDAMRWSFCGLHTYIGLGMECWDNDAFKYCVFPFSFNLPGILMIAFISVNLHCSPLICVILSVAFDS